MVWSRGLFFLDDLSFQPVGRKHAHRFEHSVIGVAHAPVGGYLVEVFLETVPAINVEAALVIEAYVKIRGAPSQAVSVIVRRGLAFFHLRSTMGAIGRCLDFHGISH